MNVAIAKICFRCDTITDNWHAISENKVVCHPCKLYCQRIGQQETSPARSPKTLPKSPAMTVLKPVESFDYDQIIQVLSSPENRQILIKKLQYREVQLQIQLEEIKSLLKSLGGEKPKHAPLSEKLKNQVWEMTQAGKSRPQIAQELGVSLAQIDKIRTAKKRAS